MMTRARVALFALCSMLLVAGRARAWEPFRSENDDVRRGNEQLQRGDSKGALEAYDAAAHKLPNDPGVQLDRGLALMAQGKLDQAREAFHNAAQGRASAELRAQAEYDLGLAFLKQADAASKQSDLDTAQKLTREAVDALKGSLRAKPKNRDAAWNLELARRRLVDLDKKQEEKKKQEEQKKEQEQKENEQKENDAENESGDSGDKKPEDSDQQKEPGKKDEPDKNDDKGEQGSPEKPEDKEDQAQKPPPKPGEQDQPEPGQDSTAAPENAQEPRPLPEAMQKALDALETNDQNLQKHRAMMRAQQRPRRIEKDW